MTDDTIGVGIGASFVYPDVVSMLAFVNFEGSGIVAFDNHVLVGCLVCFSLQGDRGHPAPCCATRATGTPLGQTGRWMPQSGRSPRGQSRSHRSTHQNRRSRLPCPGSHPTFGFPLFGML